MNAKKKNKNNPRTERTPKREPMLLGKRPNSLVFDRERERERERIFSTARTIVSVRCGARRWRAPMLLRECGLELPVRRTDGAVRRTSEYELRDSTVL